MLKQIEEANAAGVKLRDHFDQIYVSYYARMLRFAKEYVLFDEEAENIVQDVFLLLWEKRHVLDVQVSLTAYLLTLVKNRCLDYLRRSEVADEYKQELEAKRSSLEQFDYLFESEAEIERQIATAIEKLPYRCREIFVKSRIEGKKYREIATELNLSENTVENQIGIALKKLRVELKEYLPILFFLGIY